MRNTSRHRAIPSHLLVQATACFMALLLWTGGGAHLVAESLPGVSGAHEAPMAGAQCDLAAQPLGSSDGEGHSPADCVVCQLLDAPTNSFASPSEVVPLLVVNEGIGASDRRTYRTSPRRIRTRAPPQV